MELKRMGYVFFLIAVVVFLAGCKNNNSNAVIKDINEVNKDVTKNIDKNIYVVTMAPPVMKNQFIAGNIDGYIAWEPFNAQMVISDEGKYLIQSTDVWENHPCCVLTTIIEDEKAIKAMLWAHLKATEFINNPDNKEKVISYAMEFTGQSREVVVEALNHLQYVDFPEYGEFRKYYESLKETKQLLNKSLSDLGYSNEEEFFEDFLYNDYYLDMKKRIEDNPYYKPEKVSREIRLSYLTGDIHQLAFYVAQKEGYFDKVFSNLKIIQFKNGPATMDGYKSGQIDFAYLGGAPATLRRVNSDIPIRVIAGVNNGGSALVVKKDINSISDLAGKTIATPGFGTVQDFILRKIALENGFSIVVK